MLGHTLPEIAAEKAGIFKRGTRALTVPQRPDAMQTLVVRARARQLQRSEGVRRRERESRLLMVLPKHSLKQGSLQGPATRWRCDQIDKMGRCG